MDRILVIQTAFIGDVILATSLVEKLNEFYPNSKIDFLLRKGNENLLENNPKINKVIVWDKKKKKYDNLRTITKQVKRSRYDCVINPHRYASSGLITALSGARVKIGFKKNPLSLAYSHRVEHKIGDGTHEIYRNQKLIETLTDEAPSKPKLYPSDEDFSGVSKYKKVKYVCIAPSSVWFTKELPIERWLEVIHKYDSSLKIYLLGGYEDYDKCEKIIQATKSNEVVNLAGKLSFLESAALMKDAFMNHVNDSAPQHIASAVNAPLTVYFCSTTPSLGFGPLSDNSVIVEINQKLSCRPCGIHGKESCPEKHFNCAFGIEI